MSVRPWLLYAGRRWRTSGLLVVLLLGTFLYGAVADRGHDPMWSDEGGDLVAVALAEDGGTAFGLRARGDGHELVAFARDGTALWNRSLGPEPFMGTGRGWVAVAEVGEPSRLTVLRARDGVPLLDTAVGGVPRALAADGETVAVALRSPDDAVLVWTRLAYDRTVRLPTFVTALDVADDTVAVGAADGTIVVDRSRTEVARFQAGMAVRSVRLDASGMLLVVGGFGPDPGDLSGGVAVYDLARERPLQLSRTETVNGVGFVDVASDGSVVLALEETPGRSSLRLTPPEGSPVVRFVAPGVVPRLGAMGLSGARLMPDGSGVAVATLAGDVQYVDSATGDVDWSWRAEGVLAVDVAGEAPGVFVASARLFSSHGYDRLVLFDAGQEPFGRDMALLVPALALGVVALGALVLGVGRTRELRG